jgi:hypothetical protein
MACRKAWPVGKLISLLMDVAQQCEAQSHPCRPRKGHSNSERDPIISRARYLASQLRFHHQSANGILLADHDLRPGSHCRLCGTRSRLHQSIGGPRDVEFGRTPEPADKFLMALLQVQAASTVCAAEELHNT